MCGVPKITAEFKVEDLRKSVLAQGLLDIALLAVAACRPGHPHTALRFNLPQLGLRPV